MFYTEYRPQKFTDLIGAEHVTSVITGALKKNTPAHAYFFTGGRGIGKTTTARLLAKALNCENPITDLDHKHVHFEACGECSSCNAIQNGTHLDLIEIDAASNRGIDDIRMLREGVGLAPTMGKAKIYIIDEVHMLTNEASNALLKTLEEPPKHAYFILCTTNPEKVLDTIKSRCIQINFKKPAIDELVEKLQKIADDRSFEISKNHLVKISKAAKGAFREAETYLEQIINGDSQFSVIETDNNFEQLTQLIINRDLKSSIEFVNKIYTEGTNIESWIEKYIDYLRTLLLVNIGVNVSVENLTEEDIKLGKGASVMVLKDLLQKMVEASSNFRYAVIQVMPIELALIELLANKVGSMNVVSDMKTPVEVKATVTKPTSEVKSVEKVVPIKETPKESPLKVANAEASSKQDSVKVEPDPAPRSAKNEKFPYKSLVESLKESNHSIYLLLSSCSLNSFDGKELVISANYSFHKERVLSMKIRTVIEDAAARLMGNTVVVRCEVSKNNPNAERLTDNNVTPVKKTPLTNVFQDVFGDNLESVNE